MIEVTVTCAWCQTKQVTNLEKPIPEGWHSASVSGANYLASAEETFCSSNHEREYTEAAPAAVKAAVESYGTTFLGRMNEARAAWTKRPQVEEA